MKVNRKEKKQMPERKVNRKLKMNEWIKRKWNECRNDELKRKKTMMNVQKKTKKHEILKYNIGCKKEKKKKYKVEWTKDIKITNRNR